MSEEVLNEVVVPVEAPEVPEVPAEPAPTEEEEEEVLPN